MEQDPRSCTVAEAEMNEWFVRGIHHRWSHDRIEFRSNCIRNRKQPRTFNPSRTYREVGCRSDSDVTRRTSGSVAKPRTREGMRTHTQEGSANRQVGKTMRSDLDAVRKKIVAACSGLLCLLMPIISHG